MLAVVFGMGAGGSAAGLLWYFGLTTEEQKAADRKAMEYADAIYKKALDKLDKSQLHFIYTLLKG